MNLRLYKKYVVTLAFAVGFMFMGYSKKKETPPAPQTKEDAPPIGLPLPIDDYIPYLFLSALCAGIYVYNKIDKKQITNS